MPFIQIHSNIISKKTKRKIIDAVISFKIFKIQNIQNLQNSQLDP